MAATTTYNTEKNTCWLVFTIHVYVIWQCIRYSGKGQHCQLLQHTHCCSLPDLLYVFWPYMAANALVCTAQANNVHSCNALICRYITTYKLQQAAKCQISLLTSVSIDHAMCGMYKKGLHLHTTCRWCDPKMCRKCKIQASRQSSTAQ